MNCIEVNGTSLRCELSSSGKRTLVVLHKMGGTVGVVGPGDDPARRPALPLLAGWAARPVSSSAGVGEFRRICSLNVENWREQAGSPTPSRPRRDALSAAPRDGRAPDRPRFARPAAGLSGQSGSGRTGTGRRPATGGGAAAGAMGPAARLRSAATPRQRRRLARPAAAPQAHRRGRRGPAGRPLPRRRGGPRQIHADGPVLRRRRRAAQAAHPLPSLHAERAHALPRVQARPSGDRGPDPAAGRLDRHRGGAAVLRRIPGERHRRRDDPRAGCSRRCSSAAWWWWRRRTSRRTICSRASRGATRSCRSSR